MVEKKGYVYQIVNMKNNKLYVGSTQQTLIKRWQQFKYNHLYSYNCQGVIFSAMRENGIESFRIEELAEYTCTKQKLRTYEGEWIRKLDSFNNGYNRKMEWGGDTNNYIRNRDKIREYQRKYRERKKLEKIEKK